MKNLKFIYNIFLLLVVTVSSNAQNFQDTKGELNISSSGSASYTIPIETPPSIKDVEPSLSLLYTSGVRGGIAGPGWSLNSISSITRMSTRKDIDGYRDGVDFGYYTDDKLALDGQRLILKSGNYLDFGSTYETEYKSNTKIEYISTGFTSYFLVTTPDGARTWYGNTPSDTYGGNSATSPTAWYIKRYEDVNGNYIKYNYTNYYYNYCGSLYIDSIEFSGNETQNIPLTNKIKFNYRDSNVIEKDIFYGQSVCTTKILSSIDVLTNNTIYRKYEIQNETLDEIVYNVRVLALNASGALEEANKIYFQYTQSTPSTAIVPKNYTTNLPFNQVSLTGDFDGDSRLDFIANNLLYNNIFDGTTENLPTITAPFNAKFTALTLTNNKLNQKQSIVAVESTQTTTSFKVYNLESNQFVNTYTKSINLNTSGTNTCTVYLSGDPTYNPCYYNYLNSCQNGNNTFNQFIKHAVGDFDGNGISEVLIEKEGNRSRTIGISNGCSTITDVTTGGASTFYLLDLNQGEPSDLNSSGFVNLLGGVSPDSIKQIADFNGDGKDDILCMYGSTYYVYEINRNSTNATTNLLGTGVLDAYSSTKQMLIGDYNGDGKLDIMLPNTEGGSQHTLWHIYYCDPYSANNPFFRKESHNIVEYWPNSQIQDPTYFAQQHLLSFYYAIDINKDGKTDMVRFWMKKYKDGWDDDVEWHVDTYKNTIGNFSNGTLSAGFVQNFISQTYHIEPAWFPIPVSGNFGNKNLNQELVVVDKYYNKINFVKFNRDPYLLNSISEGSFGGITHTLQYTKMQSPNGNIGDPLTDIYSSTNSVNYPFVEFIKNPNVYLVSQVKTQEINSVPRYQKFKYHGYVSNFEYGNIGFKRTARTNWYLSENDTKVWTVEESDITKRGANTTTWTTTNGSNVFATVPTDILSTKTNLFSTHTFPNGIYNVLLNQQTTIDVITGVTVQKNFSYDGAVNDISAKGLQTSTTTNYFNGTVLQGSTTTGTAITDYSSNPSGVGNTYFIGRPLKVTSSSTINNIDGTSDTRTSEEKYTYDGAKITKTEKKGHNTDYLVEEMTYDGVGNLLTKKVSMPSATPAIAPRTITDEYDSTKRFVTKKIDHQGFVTLLEYNSNGQIKKSTNYLGVVNDFVYDAWGKVTSNTTTGNSTTPIITTTSYEVFNTNFKKVTVTNTQGDNTMSKTIYDCAGRVIKSTTKGFTLNTEISKTTEYDGLGRKYRESEPYFGTTVPSSTKWTTISMYDYLSRPTQMTISTGRFQTINYAGLMTTSNDDGKTTSATLNAMGNKVSTTDPGGTVTFNYFASGQLKDSNYDGNIITNEIDGWGNKISTFDPNSGNPTGPNGGKYTYSYDAFGQIKAETTPKGTTTFTYDDFGKLINKKVFGDGTDFNITYTYNALAQLKKETSKTTANVDIDYYEYFYDSLNRLYKSEEDNVNFNHTKTTSFDTYGRLDTETNYTTVKGAFANNFASTVVNKYVYNANNGILYEITDGAGVSLWKLLTANEKMQTLTATLGNGIAITNTYTPDFYYGTQKHKKGTTFIVDNTYTFNAAKGNLMSRQNDAPGMNNIYEVFTYDPDDQDRLKSWTNPLTGNDDFNIYDEKGRITTNNKLGFVSYNTNLNTGIYRKDKIALNTEGLAYYNALAGNQIVSYTMFKSPIQIAESGKGKCNFTYNSHLSRTKQLYHNVAIAPSTVRLQSKTKLYTDDGSTEIIMDTQANTIKIVTFVGGDAYGAVLYNEKFLNKTTNVTSENKFYLHRDYQGTIIAISDNLGVAVEKRAFDAWGNLAKLVNSTNVSLPLANGLVVFDRGYTSHEHLQEVRLIHMNGRLYDPVLRSFLMPDNFVQQPENTQNYNRYAYVMNNPLRYTDPSGEIIPLLGAVLIGAAIGALTYTLSAYYGSTYFSWGGLVGATFIGAASGAATFGIGSAAGNLFSVPAMGFWQGAAQGAIVGGITGIGGAFVNSALTGQALTLKAVLQGAVIGGIVGGVVGGIDGGIRAQQNDANFWSGKSNWQEIKIGKASLGLNKQNVDFGDSKWEVKSEMKLKQFNQGDDTLCTYRCKQSVDDYFGVESNNKSWFQRASANRMEDRFLESHYKASGYNFNSFGPNPGSNSVDWIISEMKSNHVVQVSWMPDSSLPKSWHASLVTKVEQNVKTFAYRLRLMDPAGHGNFSFDNLKNLFSIWK